MLSRIGLSSRRERSSSSSPHGYQSTGFSACCARYGLVSFARRLDMKQEGEGGRGRRPPKGGRRNNAPSRKRTAGGASRRFFASLASELWLPAHGLRACFVVKPIPSWRP